MDINILITIIIIISLIFCLFLVNVSQYKKTALGKRPPFRVLLLLTIYISTLPVAISTLLIFKIYRSFLNVILKIKYGSEFRGLMEGGDALFTVEGVNHIIDVLMICEFDDKTNLQSPYEVLRQSFYNLFLRESERFPKFLFSFHKFMGYSFMLKKEVIFDDCVKQMKVLERCDGKLNKEDVMRLVTDCSNAPLPRNGTVLWQVLIGTQPVNWNGSNNESNSYPVMLRFHHGVADGISLVKFLLGTLADNPKREIIFPEKCKENLVHQESHRNIKMANCCKAGRSFKGQILGFCQHLGKMLDVFLLTVFAICLGPTSFYLTQFVKGKDCNILQGPLLSGQFVLALKTEVWQKYVKKIKRIKSKVPGTTFSEVLFTAFSASLNEYFVKNSSSYPRYITMTVPVLSGSSELQHLTPGDYDINLENQFSLVYLNLPLYIKDEDGSKVSKPVLKRLEMLKAETSAIKNSFEYEVNHWLLSVFVGLLPHVVMKYFMYLPRSTIFASILPGPPKVTVCGGSSVQDIAFWFPHMGNTGVSFSAFTYDGRLQMGLNVDKALISDEKEAESILNGVYKFIDILDEETSESNAKGVLLGGSSQ